MKGSARAPTLMVLLSAISACAPLSSFRPASGLMDGRSLEVGAGATLVGPRPYVEEPNQVGAQAWVSGRATKAVTLSGIGAVEARAGALGGGLRLDALRTDRFVLAPEAELGFLWAAVNVGAALRLFDQTHLYTAPRFGTRGATWALDIPAGVSVRVYEGLMLRAEYRATWTGALSYYELRNFFGAAAAYQF